MNSGQSPQPPRSLRSAIDASDRVSMISPEYNHGLSGVLKNALDWTSRPYGRYSLQGKPVLTFSGGVRAQQQLNETLFAIPTPVVLRPRIVIAGIHEMRDGRLFDKVRLRFALAGDDDLLGQIQVARCLRPRA